MARGTTPLNRSALLPRGAYLLHSRNLTIGVWDEAASGFIGIRDKFDSRFLDMEALNDPPGSGTAVALLALGRLPDDIELKGHVDGGCSECGGPVVYDEELRPGRRDEILIALLGEERAKEVQRPWPWRHLTPTGAVQPLSEETHKGGGTLLVYKPLFDWLDRLEQEVLCPACRGNGIQVVNGILGDCEHCLGRGI